MFSPSFLLQFALLDRKGSTSPLQALLSYLRC
nr:MAG TPA: hypothetical protein [Caudoviricetes sp.]